MAKGIADPIADTIESLTQIKKEKQARQHEVVRTYRAIEREMHANATFIKTLVEQINHLKSLTLTEKPDARTVKTSAKPKTANG